MKNIGKKLLALTLTLVMTASMAILPVGATEAGEPSAGAESVEPSGESNDEYKYSDAYDPVTHTYNEETVQIDKYIGSDSEVVIPSEIDGKKVTSIGGWAFENCTSLTSVTIPDSVTSIGKVAFAGCRSLTSVTIGNSVTSIGESAFEYCRSLTSITIPDSVMRIDRAAFAGCTSLTSITIPDSVVRFNAAFINCTSLTSVTIGNSVTSISEFAFQNCTSLTSITIPDSVTSIGKCAFYGCTSLTSIAIPDSVTSISEFAFQNCNKLTDVYFTGTEEEWNNININANNDPLLCATIHFNSTMPDEQDEPVLEIIESESCKKVEGDKFNYYSNCQLNCSGWETTVRRSVHFRAAIQKYDKSYLEKFLQSVSAEFLNSGGSGNVDFATTYEITPDGASGDFVVNVTCKPEPITDYIVVKTGTQKIIVQITRTFYKSDTDVYTQQSLSCHPAGYNLFSIKIDGNSYINKKSLYWDDGKPVDNPGFVGRIDYSLDGKYLRELLRDSPDVSSDNSALSEKQSVIKEVIADWSGACYGITLCDALVYAGYVDISDITNSNATTNYQLNPRLDRDPSQTDIKYSNMIDYYHLSQHLSSLNDSVREMSYDSEVDPKDKLKPLLQRLVQKATEEKPFPLSFFDWNYGHSVLVLGCEEDSSGYHLIVYDSDINNFAVHNYFTINKDFSGIQCNNFLFDGLDFGKRLRLDIIDIDQYKDTVVLSENLKNFDNYKLSTIPTTVPAASGSADKQGGQGDDTIKIKFGINSSFAVTNSNGEQLRYIDGQFSGDMAILNINPIVNGFNSQYMVYIPYDPTYEFENIASGIDIGIVAPELYCSVKSENLDSFTLNTDEGIVLHGENYDFTSHIGTKINGDVGLAAISGSGEKDLTINCTEQQPKVSSQGTVSDVTITSYTLDSKTENKYDTVPSSFSINSEDATIIGTDIPDDKPKGTYGDLDGDGDITANDALMILRASVGMETLTPEQIALADVDGDGDITANDALVVLRYSVGMGDGGNVGKEIA